MKYINMIKTIIITLVMIGLFALFGYQQTHYVRVGHATFVKQMGVENLYSFTDSTGQAYNFITTDIISPYDTIKANMYNNKTEEDIKDDMLVNYKIVSDFKTENEK